MGKHNQNEEETEATLGTVKKSIETNRRCDWREASARSERARDGASA
jgi:hypothetical protein